ncbi:MAG: DUF2007 domain-containing protein [Gammaproteobacteria bacterium]|nr:DUF2007 domain-containing protein [Gammaproteobacteria bacterium]
MAHLIFKLRQVPDDEAEDVRQLLDKANINYYETDAGNWGISMPGLWLAESDDVARARELIDDYQRERSSRVKNATNTRSFASAFLDRPFYTIGLILFCAVLLYFMTKPFLVMFNDH